MILFFYWAFVMIFMGGIVVNGQTPCCTTSGSCLLTSSAQSCWNYGGVYMPNNTCQACTIRISSAASPYVAILDNNLNGGGITHLYGNVAMRGQGTSGIGQSLFIHGQLNMGNSAALGVISDTFSLINRIGSIQTWLPMNGYVYNLKLSPGFYYMSDQANLAGNLIFNGAGIYVIKIENNLIWSSGVETKLTNGAKACDIYWMVGQSISMASNTVHGNFITKTNMNIGNVKLYGAIYAPYSALSISGMTIYSCRSSDLSTGGSIFDTPRISVWASCKSRLSNTQCITFWNAYNPNAYSFNTSSIISWSCQSNATIRAGLSENFAYCLSDCNAQSTLVLTMNGISQTIMANSSESCYGACKYGNCSITLPNQCPYGYFSSGSCPPLNNQTLNNTIVPINGTLSNTTFNTTLIPINQTSIFNQTNSNHTLIDHPLVNNNTFSNITLSNQTIPFNQTMNPSNQTVNGTDPFIPPSPQPPTPPPAKNSTQDDGSWHICI